jgi:hypothetical protein
MKLKIMETTNSVTPSLVYVNEQIILKLVIKDIVKYVTLYV